MTILLLSIIFGTLFAYVALQNTAGVPFHLGAYGWNNVPLYIVALGGLVLGLAVSWVFNVAEWIGSNMTIHSKDRAIRERESDLAKLENEIHELELENAELRGEKQEIKNNGHEYHHEKEHRPDLLAKLRQNFTT